jgi:hypothetical protein
MRTLLRSGLMLSVLGAACVCPLEIRAEVRFNRDIQPILCNRSFKSHGPDLKKGGLNLQEREEPSSRSSPGTS